jgi:Fe-S-cluster containining protein
MTPLEWRRLESGLEALGAEEREDCLVGVREMLQASERGEHRLCCPFLNREAGECRIYDARPAACRTYGFYLAGRRELWCSKIDETLDEGGGASIRWGNHHLVERQLVQLSGPRVPMEDWWRSRLAEPLTNKP